MNGSRERCRPWSTAAFEREDETNLVRALWREDAMTSEWLAETGGEVIGYCAFSPVTCKPALEGLLLGLAPVAVAPEYQRQGVGAALIKTGLDECRKKNVRLVAVLGEPEYYSRFGFAPASQKQLSWSGGDAGDAFQIIADEQFGADKPRIIHYHPAFDTVS